MDKIGITKDEVIIALKSVQKYCTQTECEQCMFYKNSKCMVNTPYAWYGDFVGVENDDEVQEMKEEKDYKQTAKQLIAMWEDTEDGLLQTLDDRPIENLPRTCGRLYQLGSCISDLKEFFDLIEVKQCK